MKVQEDWCTPTYNNNVLDLIPTIWENGKHSTITENNTYHGTIYENYYLEVIFCRSIELSNTYCEKMFLDISTQLQENSTHINTSLDESINFSYKFLEKYILFIGVLASFRSKNPKF